MEIFKFIKWMFRHIDAHELFLALSTLTVFSGMFVATVFGLKAFLIFLVAITSLLVLACIVFLMMVIHKQWKLYKKEKEDDEWRILNRLRGE